ncbi:hypothetical protein D3C72_681550 [compost metagenome]
MRSVVTLFTFLLPIAFAKSYAQTKLKVITYSIKYGENPFENKSNIEDVGKFLYDMQADFVALQAVDSVTTRSGKVNQAQEFEQITSLYKVFSASQQIDNGKTGVLLLSKWPITSTRIIKLPDNKLGTPQTAIIADVKMEGNKSVTFICANLDDKYGANRENQLNAITKAANTDNPVILAGNLNIDPADLEFDSIKKKWQDTGNSAYTYDFNGTQKRIDYILLSKKNTWNVVEYKVYPQRYSDHFPVVTKLEVF